MLSIAFAPDGARLVSASADGTVRFWRAEPQQASIVDAERPTLLRGQLFLTLEADRPVRGLSMSRDATTLATWDRSVVRLWSTESSYDANARFAADLRRESHTSSVDVLRSVAADRTMDSSIKDQVIEYTRAQGDSQSLLIEAARAIVLVPGRSARDYDRAVALAEAANRAAPWWPTSANTLGAAYYRVGRYSDALTMLDLAARLRHQPDPIDPVFAAMANQRLGRTEQARQALEQLEVLLKARSRTTPEITALAAEGVTVVRGQPPQPR